LFILTDVLGIMMVVDGNSMVPTYHDGDLLVIQKDVDKSRIEPYKDVIVFYNPSPPPPIIVHRVIDRLIINNQLYFKTKGDNNPIPDQFYPGVPDKNVIGIVIWNMPVLGRALTIIYSPITKGVISTLIIIAIVIEVFYSKD